MTFECRRCKAVFEAGDTCVIDSQKFTCCSHCYNETDKFERITVIWGRK